MFWQLFTQIDIPTPTNIPQSTPSVPLPSMPEGAAFTADLSIKAVSYWNSFFKQGDMVTSFQLAVIIFIIIGGCVMIYAALSSGD